MVGGSTRRDEGSFSISNSNGFSALVRKKKKSDKVKKNKKVPDKEPEPPVFWAPAPLNSKSWADIDDEDDDDYLPTMAPLQAVWTLHESEQSKAGSAAVEESESEDDMLDLGDDDGEEEHEHEEEVVHLEPAVPKVTANPIPPAKENERQLSKKERKKKELEELEALLADFGVGQKEGKDNGAEQEKKDAELKKDQASDNGEKKDAAPSESKNAEKKKKKDKSSKENKETENHANNLDVNGHPSDSTETEPADEDASAVDVKERLKKVAAGKKKKSGKELDGASKAAAQEAALRNAKLAAAKKKEKNHHYNQHPVR